MKWFLHPTAGGRAELEDLHPAEPDLCHSALVTVVVHSVKSCQRLLSCEITVMGHHLRGATPLHYQHLWFLCGGWGSRCYLVLDKHSAWRHDQHQALNSRCVRYTSQNTPAVNDRVRIHCVQVVVQVKRFIFTVDKALNSLWNTALCNSLLPLSVFSFSTLANSAACSPAYGNL